MVLEALFSDDDRDEIFKLCDVIRETSFAIHKFHRYGHLEKVYENALDHRLTKLGSTSSNKFPYPSMTKTVRKSVITMPICLSGDVWSLKLRHAATSSMNTSRRSWDTFARPG